MSETPKHLKFTQTHEWINGQDDHMSIGITEHAQELLGDMVYVDLPDIGTHIKAGDEIGVVESVKAASDFYAPVSGEVVAINQAINDDPALVNKDPYGAGWLIKIKASNPQDINALLDAEQYQKEIAEDH